MSRKTNNKKNVFNLKGHFLVAMPGMEDSRFARSVVLICAHSGDGSMGFIINQPVAKPSFTDILKELDISFDPSKQQPPRQVFHGGPVEQGRGFVIHSLDYSTPASSRVDDLVGVSATIDALQKIAGENGPENSIMLLGYAGWAEGQLEQEIAQNGWLTMPATHEILFKTPHHKQYEAALAQMGISEELLSANSGHA